jgi:hypothetical protein
MDLAGFHQRMRPMRPFVKPRFLLTFLRNNIKIDAEKDIENSTFYRKGKD